MDALIFNIQRFSTEDGPGLRSTVFFKGCPMRCPWCHNPESQAFQPELVWNGGRCIADKGCLEVCSKNVLTLTNAGLEIDRDSCHHCGRCVTFCPSAALEMHGERRSVNSIAEEVLRDRAFYAAKGGGVTLSGGEALSQSEAALALMERLHQEGVHIALDTCGVAKAEIMEAALKLADLVLLDIKAVDPAQHLAFTGLPFSRIEETVALLNKAKKAIWVRTPVIPGYTADERVIRDIARYVAGNVAYCERYDLLAFSNLCTSKYEQLDRVFPLSDTPLLDAASMNHYRDIAQEAGLKTACWSGAVQRLEKDGACV